MMRDSPEPQGRIVPLDVIKMQGKGNNALGRTTINFDSGDWVTNSAGANFTPHVVNVNTGEDVAGKIIVFSQKSLRAICILSANVTIRQPCTSGGMSTYEGRFEILSLCGSFSFTVEGVGLRTRTGGLSVSLAGADGRVIGGGVAGLLTAASPIQTIYEEHNIPYVQPKRS